MNSYFCSSLWLIFLRFGGIVCGQYSNTLQLLATSTSSFIPTPTLSQPACLPCEYPYDGKAKVTWLVRDADTLKELNNITVHAVATLYSDGDLPFKGQTTETNSFGEFTLSLPKDGTYGITFHSEGYYPITVNNVQRQFSFQPRSSMEPLLFIRNIFTGSGTVSGKISLSRAEEPPASRAKIEFRYGINNVSGPIILSAKTSASGEWSVSSFTTGYYTALVTRKGYQAKQFTFVVLGGKEMPELFHGLIPDVDCSSQGEVRVLMIQEHRWVRWLDLVVEGPVSNSSQRGRVEYSGSSVSADGLMDNCYAGDLLDITMIKKQLAGDYKIVVYDFEARKTPDDWNLASSNAIVQVYRGNFLWSQLFVPNRKGNTWVVAAFNGLNLTIINEMSSVVYNN